MPKIIREKYENGVLVERQTEGSIYDALALAHARRAYGHRHHLVVLVVITVHDSMALRATLSEEDASQASCKQPWLWS